MIQTYRKRLFAHLAFFIFFIFIINYAATKFHWYSSLFYFDMITHFMGGFWLGLFFIWLFKYKESSFNFFFKVVLGVLAIGIIWEFYQIIINNIYAQNPFDLVDTVLDVFFDFLGGLFSIFYFLKILKIKNNN